MFLFPPLPTSPKSYVPNFIVSLLLSNNSKNQHHFTQIDIQKSSRQRMNKKCQSKTESTRKTWSLFCVDQFLLYMSWSVINISINSPLEKNDLLFARTYQLQVTFWLGWDSMDTSLSQTLHLARTCAGLVCDSIVPLYSYVHQPNCVSTGILRERRLLNLGFSENTFVRFYPLNV